MCFSLSAALQLVSTDRTLSFLQHHMYFYSSASRTRSSSVRDVCDRVTLAFPFADVLCACDCRNMEQEWLMWATPPESLRCESSKTLEVERGASNDEVRCMLCQRNTAGQIHALQIQLHYIQPLHFSNVQVNLIILQALNSISKLVYSSSGQKQLIRPPCDRGTLTRVNMLRFLHMLRIILGSHANGPKPSERHKHKEIERKRQCFASARSVTSRL